MLSADSTSLMLAADRALPARDHPRTRLTVTGIELLVTLHCTQGRQVRLSGKEKDEKENKKERITEEELCSCSRQPTCPVARDSRPTPQIREGDDLPCAHSRLTWEALRLKRCFFGYFLCTSKESDPRYSIAEALDLKQPTNKVTRFPLPRE